MGCGKWEASLGVSFPFLPPYQPISYFSDFWITFVQLFGGLPELRFLQALYSWKDLDVQFPKVLSSLDLELQSSRYHAWKEGDAVLKYSVTFFLKKFISSNPGQILSSPFDEKQLRPCSSIWSSLFVPFLSQSIQFIARSWVKNCQFFFF